MYFGVSLKITFVALTICVFDRFVVERIVSVNHEVLS
jgi:hypothetical protein